VRKGLRSRTKPVDANGRTNGGGPMSNPVGEAARERRSVERGPGHEWTAAANGEGRDAGE